MESARELASNGPKQCASLIKRRRNLARSPLRVGPRRKKTSRGQTSAFPSETSRFAPFFDSRAQGFSNPLARRRSSCPPSSTNLVLTRSIARAAAPYQAFRESVPCLLSATTSRRAPNKSSEKAHLVNTILNQPNRGRVSTDRLNREDNRLAASLKGEFSPTLAGKTLQHSYPPKNGFREERARNSGVYHIEFSSLFSLIGSRAENTTRRPDEFYGGRGGGYYYPRE